MIDKDTYLPLFVYGTLMRGQPAFYLLAKAVLRSTRAVVNGMAMYNAGAYPAAIRGAGRIRGEVHWLENAGYASLLDALTEYEGPAYRREQCAARLEEGETVVNAWIYIGVAGLTRRLPPVVGGDWLRWLQSQQER